jgi:hypothetical protein
MPTPEVRLVVASFQSTEKLHVREHEGSITIVVIKITKYRTLTRTVHILPIGMAHRLSLHLYLESTQFETRPGHWVS